jgi:hypothetical protein
LKKTLNERNQIHNFISSSGPETVINYAFGSDFLTSEGCGSASQEDTVMVPVPQRCFQERLGFQEVSRSHVFQAGAPPKSAAHGTFFDCSRFGSISSSMNPGPYPAIGVYNKKTEKAKKYAVQTVELMQLLNFLAFKFKYL